MEKVNLHFLQEELKRTSEWVRFADVKSAFVAVYYSAIVGFLISKKDTIIESMSEPSFIGVCISLVLLTIALTRGAYLLFRSVFPRLNNDLTDGSLFYFGTIAKKKFADYMSEMDELSNEKAEKQIQEQIYTVAQTANIKMQNVQSSMKWLFVVIALTTLLFIFYI